MSEDNTTNQVNLQLADLVAVLEILNLASTRGAFRPNEFSAIGGVYTRLYSFCEASGAIQSPQSDEASTQGNQ